MNKFTIVDIETANPDITSVCQIAIVTYENGKITDQWQTLVNPQTYFHYINVSIHGIDRCDVKNAPTIAQIADTIRAKLADNIVCSYGPFDRGTLTRIFPMLQNEWLDIIKIVRRQWKEDFSAHGYGLANVAKVLKIKQEHHHDALDDTLTAGQILLKALEESGEDLNYWIKRVKRPINSSTSTSTSAVISKQEGDPNGILYGETIAFTGALSIPRTKAVELAVQAGCNFSTSVTKKVTLLVTGEQDPDKLKGKELSSKEEKAIELINKGQKIIFLSENDFLKLIGN